MHLHLGPGQKLCKNFRGHAAKSQMHLSASLRVTCFRQQMEHKTAPIDLQLNKIERDTIKKNREKLVPLVETIVVFGRQNTKYNVVDKNPGNLQQILKLIARCGGNSVFKEHIISAPKNATYCSKTTQNEIIEIHGEEIVQKLVSEIVEAKFFAVLADEAADVSNVGQMPVVIRFVDNSSQIREEFLGFIACDTGVTGEAISGKITSTISSLGLDMSFCRAQGYDGQGTRLENALVLQPEFKKNTPKLFMSIVHHIFLISALLLPVKFRLFKI